MLEVKKIVNSHFKGCDFEITNNTESIKLFYGGNGDLYICALKHDYDNKEIINFEITKEKFELFCLFDKLYKTIITCQIHKPDPLKIQKCKSQEEVLQLIKNADEANEYLRNTTYKQLVRKKIISWAHDDKELDIANVLNIHQEKDKYRLEFIQKDDDDRIYIGVRIRTNRSRYMPFNLPFSDLYNSLQTYENEPIFHQITIDEHIKVLTKK